MPAQSELTAMTMQQVAEHMGVTTGRVNKLEQTAIRKLAIAIRIAEIVGNREADRVFDKIRGQPLVVFERYLALVQARQGVNTQKKAV